MSISTSLLTDLLQEFPNWRPQMYFKASLTALSHAIEDQVLAGRDGPLVIASFQRERFYRQEAHRYRRIADKSQQVYVLSAAEAEFKNSSDIYETIAFAPADSLAQEWHLVVIAQRYASCLVCRERTAVIEEDASAAVDNNRRFEGIWTFDRAVSQQAAEFLLRRILTYRPELQQKIEQARQQYLAPATASRQETAAAIAPDATSANNPDPFVQRLVTYLQAGQYKLLKANRSLATKEQKERLINSITTAIRRSLKPEEILQVAVQKLGAGLGVCRCIIYRCEATDATATIEHEFLNPGISSIKGQQWPLRDNPLFQEVLELREFLSIEDAASDPRIVERAAPNQEKSLLALVKSCSIFSWLLVPILYQGQMLGMVELHHCGPAPSAWKSEDIALVDAIATQIGVTLIQAEAYASLQDLNEQLAALDRTRSNLVAITGHELRTPLSTIQVCLESLASEPDMPLELRQVMLNAALEDAERMRNLVQDFLTLSQLESGRVKWHPEPLSLYECVELALSHVRARNYRNSLPQIENHVPPELPLVLADGEWLVEVLTKLLDNACKFTSVSDRISVTVSQNLSRKLEVTVADSGRGIEPNRLETVFDRFYQEEGALRRSAGGTGLGLAICRQIVSGWGGDIWAESAGKDCGSRFNFTIPLAEEQPANLAQVQEAESEPPQRQEGRARKKPVAGRRKFQRLKK
jgi:DICT domain-containing protein/signal transduction histidine kinase